MLEREAAQLAPGEDVAEAPSTIAIPGAAAANAEWEASLSLRRYRAETERVRVLLDFLARPIHAHGGSEPDPDIITAYNLAVEAALQGIRRAASSG